MDIKKILKRSKLSWSGSIDALQKDIDDILHLVESIPSCKGYDLKDDKYCFLAEDEYNKLSKKEDLLSEEMYKI